MPSLYRTRIEALLAAYTAQVGGRIVVTDLDGLLHGVGDLIHECAKERLADAYREQQICK